MHKQQHDQSEYIRFLQASCQSLADVSVVDAYNFHLYIIALSSCVPYVLRISCCTMLYKLW